MNSKESIIRIVLLSLLLYAATSLASSGREAQRAGAVKAELSARLAAIRAENMRLLQKLEDNMGEEELAQLARERLGLVMPGEKIFYFTTDREE